MTRRSPTRPRAIAGLLALVLLLLAALALARPGGGGSYGGGGGGGGGGDAGLIIDLVVLCFTHPYIGIPLLAIVVVFTIIMKRKKRSEGWSTRDGVELPAATGRAATRTAVSRSMLDRLRSRDPDFSVILFEDFLYMLYAELQRARGSGKLAELAAYLSPQAQQQLRADPGLSEVKGIVIGGMRYLEASGIVEEAATRLRVELEVNLTEVQGGGEQRLYVKDVLSLSRAKDARSRPFSRARRLDCPNCGAPLASVRGTTCESCGEQVAGGRFDWIVEAVQRVATETRPPLLTSDVAERGNELPTVTDPDANTRTQQLQARDPSFSFTALRKRLDLIFRELQLGWSSRDWMRVRPFVSDNLFQSQMYWIDLYRQARARNVTENARILRVEVANLISDRHYDAVTVRVFATGLDYTISDDGKLLSGSRSRERPYSEYWTLVRGVAAKGAGRGERSCPNCGAPLTVNMAGSCEYCQAKVTSGEFDWVLSRIEQDEAYAG